LQNIENILSYTTHPTFVNNTSLVDKQYVDGVGSAGAADANLTTKGLLEVAQGSEAASSLPNGHGDTAAYLALTTNISTSSPYIATGNYVVVTQSSGLINPVFISTSSAAYWWGASTTFSGVVSFSGGTTTFSGATTTFANANTKVGIGTSTPTLAQGLSVASSTYIAQGLAIGTTATSSPGVVDIGKYLNVSGSVKISGTASTSNLNVNPGGCSGCTNVTIVQSTSGACGTANTNTCSVTATCSGSQVVSGGGGTISDGLSVGIYQSYPSGSNAWTFATISNGTSNAHTQTAYAICISP
jgi:hypothetical protein